jgi:hypothetical protein
MPFDHARHERRSGKTYCFRAGGRLKIWTCGGNAITFDEDAPSLVRLRVHSVEDARRAEEDGVREDRGGEEEGDEE